MYLLPVLNRQLSRRLVALIVSETRRTYLVTGASGFIGANLCRKLVDRGETVHILIRPGTCKWRIVDILDKLHVYETDIRDATQVNRTVDRIHPDVIYHLATRGAYPQQNDGAEVLLVNVFGFWNLINACNRVGYELLVNTGSSSEYGRKVFAMRETDALNPDSYYAVAKSAQSLLGRHCAQVDRLPVVTLRLFSVYGPYEEPCRLIPNVMMAAIYDETIDLVSPATARDFVYVDDVTELYLMVDTLKRLGGEILNVGTGIQSSLGQIVRVTEELCGKKLDARWGAMKPRVWDSDVWVADISKLHRLTGFTPSTSVREGLEKCLSWFRDHAHFYRHQAADTC